MDLNETRAFIRSQTAISSPPLLPEIALHLAGEVTPIWHATEAALEAVNVPPPYWAFAWPGGQALARFVIDHAQWVAGKRVLDFAAGSGISGIAAAKAGAGSVIAAEIDGVAAAAIRLNADLNGVSITIETADIIGRPGNWDVVLAGDVCYERPMAERIVVWLRGLATMGSVVLLGDPGRRYLPKEGLVSLARYCVPTSLDLEDRTSRETAVWRLMG